MPFDLDLIDDDWRAELSADQLDARALGVGGAHRYARLDVTPLALERVELPQPSTPGMRMVGAERGPMERRRQG